jgi:hypothetical protein
MTFLSCVAVGVAFLLAVGLLVFAGVLLGWYIPALIEQARRQRGDSSRGGPRDEPPAAGPPGPGTQ